MRTRLPASGRGRDGRRKRSAADAISRLRHPANAGLSGFGHFTGIGSDRGDAIAFELRDIAAGRDICSIKDSSLVRADRPVGCEQNSAGQIVGMTMRHLRHQVRGRRRYHDQIAVAGKRMWPASNSLSGSNKSV